MSASSSALANLSHDFSTDDFQNFGEVFRYNARKVPAGKTFVQGQNRTLTYGQIETFSKRFCQLAKDKGLSHGDRAVIISEDDMAVIALFMSCLRAGITAVILNPESGRKEQSNMIAAARPQAFFADQKKIDDIDLGAYADITVMPIDAGAHHKLPSLLGGLFGKKGPKTHYPYILHDTAPLSSDQLTGVPLSETAYILFTSGTTSRPKGVEITHGNLLAQMKTFIRQYNYGPQTRILDILPLHHTDGLTQGPVVAFTTGASVYRSLHFTLDKVPFLLDSIYANRITHFVAVPSMLQLIDTVESEFDHAFHTEDFQFIISTAGYLDPNLWSRFEDRFGARIVNVYGLTETVCESLYCGPDEDTRKIGTIGKPVDTKTRIVDDNGQDVPHGETGELWLKGPHIMKGYFNMPEETAAVLTEDGWFKTGDLCMIDEDGFYYIVGRKKNIIIVAGMNIYPDDVANVLRGLPGILDAIVWGEEDQTWGEIVVAAVILEDGAEVDTNRLSEQFLEEAGVEMLPRKIHAVDSFPRGPAGKVIVRELREKISAKKTDKDTGQTEEDIQKKIIDIAADSFKCTPEALSPDSTADSVKGWNSLAHVEFLLSLEKEFNIKIGPRDIMSVTSLADAFDIVKPKTS